MLQSRPAADGRSRNRFIARLQWAPTAASRLPDPVDLDDRSRVHLPVLSDRLLAAGQVDERVVQEAEPSWRRAKRPSLRWRAWETADAPARQSGRDGRTHRTENGGEYARAYGCGDEGTIFMANPDSRRSDPPHAEMCQGADFIIDEEIRTLLPPPAPEELDQLELDLLRDQKCLEPLTIWDDGPRADSS